MKRLLSTLIFLSCFPVIATAETPDNGRINLFQDTDFQHGFNVVSATETPGPIDFEFSDPSSGPFWDLGPHHSRYDIRKSTLKIDDTGREFSDPGKTIRIYRDEKGESVLRLDVHADKEYSRPRKINENWIHLLIQHNFSDREKVRLADIKELVFSMDVHVRKCENLLTPEEYDPKIHCGQATPYFIFSNGNHDSPDYGDYIWFGVPLFDSRYEAQNLYAELDGDPKTIGTGKLIYVLDGATTFRENYAGVNPFFGEWAHVEIDLRPHAQEALDAAQKRGLLTHTSFDELEFRHFNLGWEVPGTFDCSLEIKNLKLLYQ